MGNIKIYAITQTNAFMMAECGSGYSLKPYFSNSLYYKGYDDGGSDYIIPDGYTVAEANDGSLYFYDKNNNYCELVSYNNCPALITKDNYYPLNLKKYEKV